MESWNSPGRRGENNFLRLKLFQQTAAWILNASRKIPRDFGVRQSSTAFHGEAGAAIAAEDCRTPRRCRASVSTNAFRRPQFYRNRSQLTSSQRLRRTIPLAGFGNEKRHTAQHTREQEAKKRTENNVYSLVGFDGSLSRFSRVGDLNQGGRRQDDFHFSYLEFRIEQFVRFYQLRKLLLF